MEYSKFKLGSLFSGSGGFELAASLCGIEPVWASEVEPYPIAVTTSRFPNMKHLGNICNINGAEIEPVDIVSLGSPCQGLSVAGLQKGLADERSELFLEAIRIIKEMREATNGRYPTFAIWENVPGAFSSNKGEDFRTVLQELIKIIEPSAVMPEVPKGGWAYADYYCGDGWSIAYRILDAQYIRTAQRRRRVFLVADFGGERARKILFESDRLQGYPPKSGTPWQAAPTDAEGSVVANDRARECVIADDQGGGKSGANFHENLSPTLTCTHGGEPAVAYTLEPGIAAREGGHIYEGVSGTLRANAGDNQMAVAHPVPNLLLDDQGGQQVNVRTDGVCPTLRAEAHGNVPAVVEQYLFENHVFKADDGSTSDCAPTLVGDHNNRVTDHTALVVSIVSKQQSLVTSENVANTLCKSARARSADDATTWKEGKVANTLNTFDIGEARANELVVGEERPIAIDRAFYNQGQNAQYDPQTYEDGTVPTLVAKGPGADCTREKVRYIVRRLTPTECARLQGFPDKWGHPEHKDDFTDEEYQFWLDVRNTHAEINGKAVKEYTKEQMVKWYNKLHTDSAEYKMWGNGVALPCVAYVMEGIVDAMKGE